MSPGLLATTRTQIRPINDRDARPPARVVDESECAQQCQLFRAIAVHETVRSKEPAGHVALHHVIRELVEGLAFCAGDVRRAFENVSGSRATFLGVILSASPI